MNPRGDKFPTAVLVAYYATVAGLFVASFYPEYRIWGITWWAYFPIWTKLFLLAVGVSAPTVIDLFSHRITRNDVDISPAAYRVLAGGVVTAMLALFYFFRARTHFLGDGYTLLSLMSNENHLIKPREFGGTIIQFGIYKLMGAGGEDVALLAYQIVSIAAGLCFLVAALLFANRYFTKRLDRVMFLLVLSSGGYMLMFCGYVENYAFFLVATLAYIGAAVLIAGQKLSRWWIIAAQAAPIFFHIFGVVLIPATLYLLAHDSPIERWVISRRRLALSILIAGFVAVVVAAFLYFYFNILYLRIAVLPFVVDRFTVDGYTMFSSRHLIDYANLILIIFPAAFVFLMLYRSQLRGSWRWSPINMALLLVVAGTFGAAFIFDPKLGMPRDWDLFAFAGIALAVFSFLTMSDTLGSRSLIRSSALLVVANLLVFGPRVAAIVSPSILTTYIDNSARLDPAKAGPTFYVLTKWLRSHGEEGRAEQVDSVWSSISPEEAIIGSYQSGKLPLDTLALLTVLDRCINRDVENWNAWANKGTVKYWQGQYDSAVTCLERAVALNPYSSWIYLNLGLGYWKLRELNKAAKCATQSYNLDSSSITPLILLASVYRQMDDTAHLALNIKRISARSDAPKEYVAGMTEFLNRPSAAPHGNRSTIAKTPPSSDELAHLALQLVHSAAVPQKDSTIWDEAVRMAVAKNPSSWVAWGNLGVVYLRKDAFDSAQTVLEIAVSINPINATNFSNLAFAQFYQSDFISAERNWYKARELDSSSVLPLIGLVKLYQKTEKHEQHRAYFLKLVSRPDAPGDYLKTYGDYYLMQKRWHDADLQYQRALANGYPKAGLDSIYAENPQLTAGS